jgi:hypothetical protein
MTRVFPILASVALAVFVLVAPAAASDGGRSTGRCSIAVDDHVGGPTSPFRMRGEGWPAGTMERLTVVEIHVRHVSTGSGSIAWLWLVPGGTWFIYDHNPEVEPNETVLGPQAPGLYRVRAQAEGYRCVARDWFVVRSFGRIS